MNRTNISCAVLICASTAFGFLSACSKNEKPGSDNIPPQEAANSSSNPIKAEELPGKSNEAAAPESGAHSTAGISGTVVLKGTPPPEKELPLSADCGKLHSSMPKTRFYVVGENGGLGDVFIHIKEGLGGKTFSPPAESVLLDQVGCEYTPYIVGLQTGQKLLVKNSDPMMHNVHALPKISGNKESNKAQMAKSPELEYTFNTPEIFVTYKCDVHPWMYAYVAVVEHPFFAVSKADGSFRLKNVPDGKYVVEAIHRKAGRQSKEISVADGKSEALQFTFEIPGL